MNEKISRHLAITGLVQGVGFRWATVAEARRLGLSGWVRNRRDGSVEAVLHGDSRAVHALIAWSRHGPAGAVVRHVAVDGWSETVEPGFRQIATA